VVVIAAGAPSGAAAGCWVHCESTTGIAATFEMSAVQLLQVDRSSRRIACWRRLQRSSCARIHRQTSPHSSAQTGRCRGRMRKTSYLRGNRTNLDRRYPNTRLPAARSCLLHSIQWMYYTRRNTSWNWHAIAGQISACSGQSASVDWASRCRAKSCLLRRWIRL